MTRPTRPGSIQSAVRAAITALGGVEAASSDLGVSLSTISYGFEAREDRPGGFGVNYLDRAGRIEPQAALPVASHFAHLAGGVFQPVDLGGATGAHIHEISREFADVIGAHASAHSGASSDPGDYTPAEAAAQITEVDELVAAALRYRAALLRKVEGGA